MSNLEKYLKSIGRQEEVKEEEITVIRNPNLEKICRSYEKWLERDDQYWQGSYDHALKTFSRKKYTAKDIEEFSLELKKYEQRRYFEKTGLFLSALINSSKDKEFTILTEHLDKRINLIGYCNKKIVNVKGNAGDIVGWWNEGTISVEGNSGNSVGFCNEGTISVKGDAGDYVGSGNEGTISVEGDAGNNVGSGNKGTISVEGKIKLLSKEANYYRTSKIYEKGKLIVNEGRITKCQI